MLAGMVENPVRYDPVNNPQLSLQRRNIVLSRMAQLHVITQAEAAAASQQPLGLHLSALQTGCTSASAQSAAFFCDYVLSVMKQDNAFSTAWNVLNSSGGLKIYTTLSGADEAAARQAVNYMVPAPPNGANPGGNAAAEVLIRPGTGQILAIANDRPYGTGGGQTTLDYAVNSNYNGGSLGVQTGSSSKFFTFLTALQQGVPFGYPQTVTTPATVSGFTNCAGQPVGGGTDANGQPVPTGSWNLINDDPGQKGAFTLYTATENSVNVYYAKLEAKVGLCNVVKTAVNLGMTRFDGKSLLKPDNLPGGRHFDPADDVPAFTLGAVNVSPMSMAAAYATVAARGIYCRPIAVNAIVTRTGSRLPVESAGCHRALPAAVADAATYLMQGVLNNGTAAGLGIGRPAAAKTGTADNFAFAAFGGFTPDLVGYVSVFNPVNPVQFPMSGTGSCYRVGCPGVMFGAGAPGHIWQMTFMNAMLANPPLNFVAVDPASPLFSMGDGRTNPTTKKGKRGRGGNGNGNGNANGNGLPIAVPTP
jgi:membrane peptidoglycan carboxypeptidase